MIGAVLIHDREPLDALGLGARSPRHRRRGCRNRGPRRSGGYRPCRRIYAPARRQSPGETTKPCAGQLGAARRRRRDSSRPSACRRHWRGRSPGPAPARRRRPNSRSWARSLRGRRTPFSALAPSGLNRPEFLRSLVTIWASWRPSSSVRPAGVSHRDGRRHHRDRDAAAAPRCRRRHRPRARPIGRRAPARASASMAAAAAAVRLRRRRHRLLRPGRCGWRQHRNEGGGRSARQSVIGVIMILSPEVCSA